MIDLLLAIAHHLLVFVLVAVLAIELGLLHPGVSPDRLRALASIDAVYGAAAALVIIVGVLRVFYGASGPDYYLPNWVFWAKMVAFLGVGLLSIQPTIALRKFAKALKADPAFVPPADAIARSRRYLWAEVGLFALIPVFAAAMARGYGL